MTTDLTKVNIPAFPKNTKDQVAVKTWRDEFIATCGLLNCRDVIKTGKVAAYSKDIVKETEDDEWKRFPRRCVGVWGC